MITKDDLFKLDELNADIIDALNNFVSSTSIETFEVNYLLVEMKTNAYDQFFKELLKKTEANV